MNPCIDAVLREIADPRKIAGISHYSHNPRATSVPLDWARQYPAVGDEAEDVIARRPDLVIAGPHVAPQTVAALARLKVPLFQVGVPATVGESQAQIAEVAHAIGREAEGRALNARISSAIARARPRADMSAPSALIWQDGGLVPGTGTLADELLTLAGFRSASVEQGLAQWDMLSLEGLIWSPPDIVMTGRAGMEAVSMSGGERMMDHPALRRAGARFMIADFPSRLLHCGGPVIIQTVERLSRIRDDWNARGAS